VAILRVAVYDVVGSSKTTVEMPDDIPMEQLLPALASKMDLPLTQAGNPIAYKFDLRRTGQRLDDQDSLRSAGVQVDDALTLVPEIIAGEKANE
jgi:hypothetical protein